MSYNPKNIPAVATMAFLRAIPVEAAPTYATVYLNGFYGSDDGGEGVFTWNATSAITDNGGTVINPTGNSGDGRWERNAAGPFKPQWFGAKADRIAFTDATISLGTPTTLTTSATAFKTFAGKKLIAVQGADSTNGPLVTLASYVSASSLTLDTPATAAVTNALASLATNDTTSINNCLSSAGPGQIIAFTSGASGFGVSGTLTKLAGQILDGGSWADVVNTTDQVVGAGIIQLFTITDIPLFNIFGATEADTKPRGETRNLAMLRYFETAGTAATAIYATNARQEKVENCYISGFGTGINQAELCWQWDVNHNIIYNCTTGIRKANESDDSRYIGNNIAPFRAAAVCFNLAGLSQTDTFIGNQCKACGVGFFLGGQSDGTGTPYPLEAVLINSVFEDCLIADIVMVTDAPNADSSLHPALVEIGGRSYITGGFGGSTKPYSGIPHIYAAHASSITVINQKSNRLSYGALVGVNYGSFTFTGSPVGPVSLQNDVSIYGTSPAYFTASITSNVMTVTAVASGTIAVGDTIITPFGTSSAVASFGTGSGGLGTYNLNPVANCASGDMTGIVRSPLVSGGDASVGQSYELPGDHQLVRMRSTALTTTGAVEARVPFDTVVSDPYNWYSGSGIVPLRSQTVRFHPQVRVNMSGAGVAQLFLEKDGSDIVLLAEITAAGAGNIILKGDGYDIADGSAEYNINILTSVAGTVDIASGGLNTWLVAELAGT